MRASTPLKLPAKETGVLLIDTIYDFTDRHGVYRQCFGVEDTMEIEKAMERIEEMVNEFRGIVDIALCSSVYQEGQFARDYPELRYLCTTELGQSPSVDVERVVHKTDNMATSAGKGLDAFIESKRNLLMGGFTGTSCFMQSITTLWGRYRDVLQLFAMKDCVASRDKQMNQQDKLFRQWCRVEEPIQVVESWEDIELV